MRDKNTFIIDQKQPYGVVNQSTPMGGQPTDLGFIKKSLGLETTITNHGFDSAPPSNAQSPMARMQAKGSGNPFDPVNK